MIAQAVYRYIDRKKLFRPNDTIIVGVSGGADSVLLLLLLRQRGYKCEAAHCNFHLRGAESDRDQTFVANLCQQLQVVLHTRHFQTEVYAKEKGISIEMAARELRYEWFESLRQERGAAVIAVAHHQDDSVETVLLNLLRGTGIDGLKGISPVQGHIVRPLLCITRKQIEAYLKRINQPYVTDSTNLQPEVTRNRIRLKLLPLMQRINPSIRSTLATMSEHIADLLPLYHEVVDQSVARVCQGRIISIEALQKEASPGTILYEALKPYGFHSKQMPDILSAIDSTSGKRFYSEKWVLLRDYDVFRILPKAGRRAAHIPPFRLERTDEVYTDDFNLRRGNDVACLDADRLAGASLALHRVSSKDIFQPLGMRGRKSVHDFIRDEKISSTERDNLWGLYRGKTLVWLIGYRIDQRFSVQHFTKKVAVYRQLPLDDLRPEEPAE